MISCYVVDAHEKWDLVLDDVVFAYNNATHSSTGLAPNEIIFGKLLPSKTDRLLNVADLNTQDIEKLTNSTASRLDKARAAQKKQYDKSTSDMQFKVGEKVLLNNPRQRVGFVRSFEPKYSGPYTIISAADESTLRLKTRILVKFLMSMVIV